MLFFFEQKTAYEMRISDWSSDVCSSDLHDDLLAAELQKGFRVVPDAPLPRPRQPPVVPAVEIREDPVFVAQHGLFLDPHLGPALRRRLLGKGGRPGLGLAAVAAGLGSRPDLPAIAPRADQRAGAWN